MSDYTLGIKELDAVIGGIKKGSNIMLIGPPMCGKEIILYSILYYGAAKNENAEIQKQIIVIALADVSSGKVQSIFIDRYISSKDSTVEQKLFWEIDNYFSIGSIIEKENQSEKTRFTKVVWQ